MDNADKAYAEAYAKALATWPLGRCGPIAGKVYTADKAYAEAHAEAYAKAHAEADKAYAEAHAEATKDRHNG